MIEKPLTLEKARKTNRLGDFIRQQEHWERENGYNGADADELECGLEGLAKEPQPADRTLRSRDGDD